MKGVNLKDTQYLIEEFAKEYIPGDRQCMLTLLNFLDKAEKFDKGRYSAAEGYAIDKPEDQETLDKYHWVLLDGRDEAGDYIDIHNEMLYGGSCAAFKPIRVINYQTLYDEVYEEYKRRQK